jgi:hypothetical protein
MKTMRFYHLSAAVLSAVLAMSSCGLPQNTDNGKGSITVVLSGNSQTTARSVLPDSMPGTLKYKLTFTSPGKTAVIKEVSGIICTVDLEAGDWTVLGEAYDSSDSLVGTGEVPVSIIAGQQINATLLMYVEPEYEQTLTDIYIHNETELRRIGTDFAIDGSKKFHLENDITLTSPWTPLGDNAARFKTLFDGGGHTVTIGALSGGIKEETGNAVYLGFFGVAEHAEIKDLNILYKLDGKVDISTGDGSTWYGAYAGGVAGRAETTSFENITVSGFFSVLFDGDSDLNVGGIAGSNDAGTITNCRVTGSIGGESANYLVLGGIAGSGLGGGITGSSFTGTVEGSTPIGNAEAGGIVGYGLYMEIVNCNYSGGSGGSIRVEAGSTARVGGIAGIVYDTVIEGCAALGSVGAEGADANAGGVAGEMQSTSGNIAAIKTSSFTGNVYAESSSPLLQSAYAGGVLGQAYSGSVEGCYAVGNVKANSNTDAFAGGIIGYYSGDSLTNSYAYANVIADSSTASYAGGIAGKSYLASIAKSYAMGTVKAEGSAANAGGIAGTNANSGQLTDCMVLLDALEGVGSADVHTLFGVYGTPASGSYSGNKVWDGIMIVRSNTTYTKTGTPDFSSYAKDSEKDIASFDASGSFQGSANQGTYTSAGWTFDAGNWKYLPGYDYPVLSWQTAPPDTSVVDQAFEVIWP